MNRIPTHVEEEWMPVPGYVGHYEVSSFGRIASLKHGKRRIRKISVHSKDRHRFVMLSADNVRKQFVVARLMLLAFVGPPPTPTHVACHDSSGNGTDYLWKIRWDTVEENNRDTVRHGTHYCARGSANMFALLDEAKVRKIKKRLARGVSQTKLAKEFGVCQGTISRIKNGRSWKHVR